MSKYHECSWTIVTWVTRPRWLWLNLSGPPWCIDFMSTYWKRWIWCSCSRAIAPWSSDLEISVVWMIPWNSGDNWSTCSGHRETLLSRSRRIFSQLRVTSKVKRRLTLTFRNHKCKTTRNNQDDRLTNIARNGVSVGRCSSWCCSWNLHEPNHQICGNDVCSWACYWKNMYMRIAHEAVVEKYVHDVIMNLKGPWWILHPGYL